jgi:hypothetical protein
MSEEATNKLHLIEQANNTGNFDEIRRRSAASPSFPEIPILAKAPKGADIAVIFQDGILTLTYWDLWCLISAKNKHASDLQGLRKFLVDQRMTEHFFSFSRRDQVEDFITLVDDLEVRINQTGWSVDSVLAAVPERLLKKEGSKGIKNITHKWGGDYPPSEPMLRSPRRLLKKEAMRGEWSKLPIDPTPIADRLHCLFIPHKKIGYFPKGTTFAFSRRLEKALNCELESTKQGELLNFRAWKYAVHRAFLALFHEEHNWDDSYGVVGDLGKVSVETILSFTPDDLCMDIRIFLKDLLMFLCWENYGLTDDDDIDDYLRSLSSEEQDVAVDILADIARRATQGFQFYNAENAEKIMTRLKEPQRPRKQKLLLPVRSAEFE